MNAGNSINTPMSIAQMREILRKNPSDIPTLVKLASLLKTDLKLKRQLLQQILTLEPANKAAREMMLELDRTEMQSGQFLTNVSSSTLTPLVGSREQQVEPREQEPEVFVSNVSLLPLFILVPLLAFNVLLLFMSAGEWQVFGCFSATFLVFSIPLWFITVRVRMDSSSLRKTRLFGLIRQEVEWSEVSEIKYISSGVRVTTLDGRKISIPSSLRKFAAALEWLSRMRPDLFASLTTRFASGDPASLTRTFQKGFAAKYVYHFLAIISTMAFLTVLVMFDIISMLVSGVTAYLLWKTALHTPHTIQVNGNRMITQASRRRHEFTASQVGDVSVVKRTRRGISLKYVQIDLVDGTEIYVYGFPGSAYEMHNFLLGWWQHYKNA